MSALPRDPLAGTARSYSYACSIDGATVACDGTTNPPVHYHIGATLEDAGAAALNTDQDCQSSAAGGGAGCPNTQIMIDGFAGLDTGACAAADTWGSACYDLAQ